MALRTKDTASEDFGEHAFVDTSDRFPFDQLLRRHGFRIYARANNKEPLWERNREHFTQRKALRTIDRRIVREVQARENYKDRGDEEENEE